MIERKQNALLMAWRFLDLANLCEGLAKELYLAAANGELARIRGMQE